MQDILEDISKTNFIHLPLKVTEFTSPSNSASSLLTEHSIPCGPAILLQSMENQEDQLQHHLLLLLTAKGYNPVKPCEKCFCHFYSKLPCMLALIVQLDGVKKLSFSGFISKTHFVPQGNVNSTSEFETRVVFSKTFFRQLSRQAFSANLVLNHVLCGFISKTLLKGCIATTCLYWLDNCYGGIDHYVTKLATLGLTLYYRFYSIRSLRYKVDAFEIQIC